MAILKRQLHHKMDGSHQENDDFWYLCYDTDAEEFFIQHEWDYVNPYRATTVSAGTERLEAYNGPGSERIDAFKAELLAEAANAQRA